jgi:hypothetical protein
MDIAGKRQTEDGRTEVWWDGGVNADGVSAGFRILEAGPELVAGLYGRMI